MFFVFVRFIERCKYISLFFYFCQNLGLLIMTSLHSKLENVAVTSNNPINPFPQVTLTGIQEVELYIVVWEEYFG